MVTQERYADLMSGFTKLFGSIIHSTVWQEEMHVKVLWITMLAMCNRRGFVEASIPGLAAAAKITLEQCEEGLNRLSSPDPYSRTKEHEGRRIAIIPGGFAVLNYMKYRQKIDEDAQRIATAERVRRHRAKRVVTESVTVTPSNGQKRQAEAEADKEEKKKRGGAARPSSPAEVQTYLDEIGETRFTGEKFFDHYQANGWKVGSNPMKDWHAAVRTWRTRQRDNGSGSLDMDDPDPMPILRAEKDRFGSDPRWKGYAEAVHRMQRKAGTWSAWCKEHP